MANVSYLGRFYKSTGQGECQKDSNQPIVSDLKTREKNLAESCYDSLIQ